MRSFSAERRSLYVTLVLLLFSVVGVTRHLHNYGEDLASSYVACRLLASGQNDHVFHHSKRNFSAVEDSAWVKVANDTGFAPARLLHPYVQTPLWAYSLEPACTRMHFHTFFVCFLAVFMASVSGMLWLVARYWTPLLFHPLWLGLVYLGLYRSEPMKYAMFLAQTHVLYLFMTVAALILAQRGKQASAGILLGFAAIVKITPGVLLFYWLITGRRKAAAYLVGTLAALTAAGYVLLGSKLMHDYGVSLSENSHVLLLAFNNQSLAAWWGGAHTVRKAVLYFYIFALPTGLRIVSSLLTVAAAIVGGLLDRRVQAGYSHGQSKPLYGAVFALVGATMFMPIAWTHYYVLLVLPAMFFVEAAMQRRAWGWLALVGVILLLNIYPISYGSVHFQAASFTIIRSQFYAGILALAGLLILATQKNRVIEQPLSAA